MIRTDVVKLTSIPASAYRQKLQAGGAGIVILRADSKQPGIASISKTSGEPIPAKNTSAKLYPAEAFSEAITLTAGLPYKKRSAPNIGELKGKAPEEKLEPELEVIIDSEDYQKVVDAYTDKTGRLSYELLNKDLIRFINSSSTARAMIAEKEDLEKIRLYAVGSKFRSITNDHELSDAQVLKMAELLDEVYPKGVFRDFNEELRRKLK